MITLIVPTRNRARTLRLVLETYYGQASVNEIIFVIDDGTDETPELIASYAARFSEISTIVIQNDVRKGASESRNIGVAASRNEYILFCDDDEYLEPRYGEFCLEKLRSSNASVVSGRRVYMIGDETPQAAVKRFGSGMRSIRPFNALLCEYINGAKFEGDIKLPITNAIILTKRSLLLAFPYDSFYARGNGYREETDFQMNLFVHGHDILVTNGCHSIHLPMKVVRTGGQRISKLKRIFWSIYYTRYFYGKYFDQYSDRIGLRTPRWIALSIFGVFSIYRELLRPTLYKVWVLAHNR